MMRTFVWLAFYLFAASAHAEDCAKLNSGDGFRELSAILDCQERRIKMLEQGRGVAGSSQAGVTTSIAADGIWRPGKCFPYEKGQPFKIAIIIEQTEDTLPLCWKDGTVIGKVSIRNDLAINLFDPGGFSWNGLGGGEYCNYSHRCTLKGSDGTVTFYPEMLVAQGGKLARLTIESRPN